MKYNYIIIASLTLAACSDNDRVSTLPPVIEQQWQIGPVIDGENYSVGMPLYMSGNSFSFPLFPGHINYITKPVNGLAGKSKITIRYRIEASADVKLIPKCCSQLPSIGPTLYFQRRGDDWNKDGWRWWSTFATKMPIEPGEFEISVSLNDNWTSVEKMTAKNNPVEFKAAIDNAARVGFTFGGGDGYGHGVYATGPAKFVLEDFIIE